MAPEQARGKPVDTRADIWAFGCVLYEMLTGRRAFEDEDVSMTLSKVLQRDPDLAALPPAVPPRVRQVLRACLQKNPRQRLGSTQDVRLALDGAFETDVADAASSPAARLHTSSLVRRVLPLAITAVTVGAMAGAAGWILKPADPRPVIRFALKLPEGRVFRGIPGHAVTVAPDARHFVYAGTDGLYVRTLETLEDRLIRGAEGVLFNPVLSPDGQSVVYVQSGQLKRISVTGGAALTLAAAASPLPSGAFPFGISWEADGTILYGQLDGIWRVSENGGDPQRLIPTESGEQVYAPQRLPRGDWILFTRTRSAGETQRDEADIVAQSLASGERRVLRTAGSHARYVPTGHLVYAQGNTLYAVAFDVDNLEMRGGPVPVVEGVRRVLTPGTLSGAAQYQTSPRTGRLSTSQARRRVSIA